MNIIRKIFRGLGMAAMMTALLSTAVACSDDLLGDGEIRQNADGTYGPFDIAVSFDAEANDSHTRATFSNDGFKLECAWVAMFTAKTGKLVAMAESDPSSFGGTAPDTNHGNGAGDNYKVILRSLMLNDEYDEVVIAGVANYNDVMALDSDGNEMPLIEALREIKDIRGYKDIAVTTSSAEQAMGGENKPLMAGFWGNGHGNFTVSQAGDIYAEQERTFKVKMLDTNTKKVIGQTAIDGGMIHLRRLYSKLNVGITIDSKAFRKFENPRLKVYNVPAYAFITEHKTIEDASQEQYDNETWPYRTHTAADIYENGFFETEVISADELKKCYSTTEKGAFLMDPSDAFTVGKDGDNMTINFGFWHYETKHWGLPGVKSQNDRGRMHGDSGIYSSLCPSVDKNFNNNAALMVLTADVVSADGKFSGTADFYIHEGYCCQPNGLAATSAEEASRDFSTFRNTEYTYAVRISGMESVDAKVSSRDLSDDFYYGVGGDLYSESVTRSMPVPEGGISYDIELPGDELYWYIDSEGETFGVPLGTSSDLQKWYGGVYKYTGAPEIKEDNEFYQSILLDGQLLGDAVAANTRAAATHTISFTGTPGVNGMLYLCAVQRSLDNRVTYHTLYAFDQLGKLATPKLEMLKAPAGNVMMGIDDHTVYWKPVTGASTYTIELAAEGAMGGYKVTLNPENGPVSDAQGTSPINVKINKETIGGSEYLKFKIRYANSAKGMLSFLQSADSHQVTIKVTAHKANGESSEPGTITRTILNPVWDLTSDPWKSAIQAKCNGEEMPHNTEVSLNGLTYHSGTAPSTTKYQQFSSVYGLRPGGAGNLDPVTRLFSFHSCSDRGKLTFWTSSNSGNASSGRYIMVDYDGRTGDLVQSPDAVTSGTLPSKGVATSSFYPANYDVAGSQNVRFYNSGDLVYYKIQYTPEDQ